MSMSMWVYIRVTLSYGLANLPIARTPQSLQAQKKSNFPNFGSSQEKAKDQRNVATHSSHQQDLKHRSEHLRLFPN